MNPRLRNGLIAAAGIVVALAAGWEIANEELLLVGLLGGGLALWLASRLMGVRVDLLLAGCAIIGYLVGNRGFAQLSVPRLPLLPAELTLGIGLLVVAWVAVRSKTLPVRRDALNFVLLAWLAFGCVRLRFDFRTHGVVALRDFALLYYGLFFFLAQNWGAVAAHRRWLERCLDVAFALAPPVFLAFARWPEFFTSHLTVRGVPLIFIKSDVEGGLLVAGMFWFLHRNAGATHRWWLGLAAANLAAVAMSNSRAALVALAAASAWPLVCRDWRLVRPLAGMLAAGVLLLVTMSAFGPQPWTKSPAYRMYEAAATILDVEGLKAYRSDDLSDKPDNNRFRLTWWRTVIDQTMADGPWFGLGFGTDLAEQFTRVYYADTLEEFSARSPHNFVLTVFGRMGFVGLALLLALVGGICALLWRTGLSAARGETDHRRFVLALGAWGVLVSACFGVVLEGPMGAVVFWTALGLANAPEPAGATDEAGEEAAPAWGGEGTAPPAEAEPALPSARHSA